MRPSSQVEVVFLPSGQRGRVRPGARLLDAALEGDVNLRHVCGGNANCTTCRVQVQDGGHNLSPLNDKESGRLPDERLAAGWRLACQARVRGPVTVRIPSLLEQIREREEPEWTM
ncbi:MAG: 2Fe-2S iron-sulfur cluster-binding protein [Candidatus Eremiobacterota bacterium]